MINLKKSVLVFVLMAVLSGAASAAPWVSLNGKFLINYPEDWYQVDFRTVDYYLSRGGTTRAVLQYEVALAPKDANPWNAKAYMMLTLDTLLNMTPKEVDSILNNLSSSIDRSVNKSPSSAAYDAVWRPLEVTYWPGQKVASVSLEPKTEQGERTRTQVVIKFYDRGTANFYFYAPDSLWTQYQTVFAGILGSFSTENIEAALPKETHKVASAEEMRDKPSGKLPKSAIPIGGGVIVVLIAFLVARRRRARKANTTSPE